VMNVSIALGAGAVGGLATEGFILGRDILRDARGTSRFRLVLMLAVTRSRFRADTTPATPGLWMRVGAWLMPSAAGREWLAEAYSVMFEARPHMRRAIKRSYLLSVGRVLMMAWAAALMGRLRARGAGLSGWRKR
jgi:hypothetical protein